MNLIDTHCHLDYFGDEIDSILQRAKEAFIEAMILCGTNPTDWDAHKRLADLHQNLHYTVGIHPTNVDENWERDLELLESFFQGNSKPVAIGEIGLDYHYLQGVGDARAVIALQKEVFRQQLLIARQKHCPIVIHSRDAFEDCKQVIDQSGCDWHNVVIHCFSENGDGMREINARGGRASFTGIVTYKNAENVRQALRAQGIERLMLETDCPYLAPVPWRSQRNEPAFLRETARYVANLLGLGEAELCALTTRNARQFFKISS
ncbi:MAG: TatD family hydrolase [Puniceicoccales bacterium]|jgi:TatD DNase family protein|nr:TatD family hydrolase [Puniceicoccales bacterium]